MMNECHMSYTPAMIALFVITAGCQLSESSIRKEVKKDHMLKEML